jgi:uncharacterized protein (TIGR02001 family)
LLLPLLWAQGTPANAEWRGEVSLLTDYFYRGYSKSRGNPVIQGRLDFEHASGGFAGMAISSVSFDDQGHGDRASVEFRPSLGFALPLTEDWRADVSATGYVYDGKLFGVDSDYVDLHAALHFRQWLTARLSFAPDAYQRGAGTLNYEIQGRHDLLDNLQVSAGLGYHQARQVLDYDYFYWNAGVTWYLNRYVAADLRYVDADVDSHPHEHAGDFSLRALESNILFSISAGF